MRLLKQSTAFTFRIGPFVDSTDGVTAETGLSIGQADIQISKNGGAFAQTSAAPTTSHDADGWYQCPLTTTDTGTLGPLTVQVAVAGALPVWEHFMVVPANIYDSFVGGTDFLEVDAQQWNGTEITNALESSADVADAVWDEALSGHTTTGSAGDTLSDAAAASGLDAAGVRAAVGLASANLDTQLSTIDGNVDSILEDTGTTIPATLSTIAGYVDTEIAAILTDTGTTLDAKIDAIDAVVDAIKAVTDNLPDSGALSTIDGLIDAIKAKTDSLTFTKAGEVDSNIQSMNGTTLLGSGTSGDKWRGA